MSGRRKSAPKAPAGLKQDGRIDRARAAWIQGDWTALAAMADVALDTSARRDRVALLVAAGLAQQGQLEAARGQAQKALDWGCPPRLVAEVLSDGLFNTLGRVASLLGDAPRAAEYFAEAARGSGAEEGPAAAGRNRDIREKTALGLLPEAAALMEQELERLRDADRLSPPEATIFQSQLDQLNHALSLAQRRGQLGPGTAAGAGGLANRAVSQLGQELWVLEKTGMKHGGFFVEFGATDGVLLSNTYLLETEFGWTGLCAEPNPDFFAQLQENRSCTVAPDCIGGETGRDVEFVLADEYGGVADYLDADHHGARRAAFRDSGRTIRLTTISLEDFLEKHDAPRQIDYLSIDTEGSEYEILAAFPFEDWDIRLITVEHNFTPMREDIRTLLERHGYVRQEVEWDDWYAKPAG